MSSTKPDNQERIYIAKGGSIPQTTLKIRMPAGAKPPPAAPSVKPSSGQKGE
jgi:hypothetical protein